MHRSVGQEDRHLHDEVQALVAIRLGLGDVVLDLDDRDVRLIAEHLGDPVHVRGECTHDPDARDVADVGAHRVEVKGALGTHDLAK